MKESDAKLRSRSLCEPLLADAGLNRWLKKEREEAYSDWLAWILEQLQTSDVLKVLGLSEIAVCSNLHFRVQREYYIPAGRLDLLLTLDDSIVVIIEVKKSSAEAADTEKKLDTVNG